MDKEMERDILVARAEPRVDPVAELAFDLGRTERVQGLLDLAEQLQGILVPVEPHPHFRRRLHGDLILEAQRREGEPEASLFRQHRKGILLGAAAVGSVASVVGVAIAFVIRHRHGGITRIAAG